MASSISQQYWSYTIAARITIAALQKMEARFKNLAKKVEKVRLDSSGSAKSQIVASSEALTVFESAIDRVSVSAKGESLFLRKMLKTSLSVYEGLTKVLDKNVPNFQSEVMDEALQENLSLGKFFIGEDKNLETCQSVEELYNMLLPPVR